MIKKFIRKDNLKISNKASLNSCRVHVMPVSITDADITALFNGIVSVVKRKCELETKRELVSMSMHHDKLIALLKEKQCEINRLKNEILYLKNKIYDEN